jgi:glycine dehydrogenase subunit 1
MPYIPHTEEDRREMLAAIGVTSLDELFADVPAELRLKRELNVPPSMDEHRLLARLFELSRKNRNCVTDLVCFLGAGIYDRYIPATVGALISRGEFLTAYTPYQPELSQGYLQTIYEFQTMVAELYGMDLANASLYDGATATAEAALMAQSVNGRRKIAVCQAVHPHYRQVLQTYCWSMGLEVVELPVAEGDTRDYSRVDSDTACVVVQFPNFFGCIEGLAEARDAATRAGSLLVVVADPIACALLETPGEFGADVVVGEGQPLGIAMGFGGPALGLFATRMEHIRRIPGRIVGRTTDEQGRTGYVMTLRTREQDIRREKATSNICTNEALMALSATIYMAALGRNGMRQVAEATVRNTQYAISQLTSGPPGAGRRTPSLRFPSKVFGEFVLELPKDATDVRDALLHKGILAGLPLGPYYAGMEQCLLIAVTETRTKAQIDAFAEALAEALA